MDLSLTEDDSKIESVDVVSTASYSLNDALGCDGLPCGRLIQYYGNPGSGKSLMSMLAIIEAQKKDPTAFQLFIDAEQTFDRNWAKKLGANVKKIILVDGETACYGRKCLEMLVGVPKEDSKTHAFVGKSEPGILDRISYKELNINLIVLDSLGALIPPGEDVAKVGKVGMALMARFLSTAMKKVAIEVSKANVPMIVINHIKATMDMYGPDHTSSGGNSYFHTLSANIFFEGVTRKDAQILDEDENKIGGTIRFTIEKSKFGPYPKKGEFRILFSEGIVDEHLEVIAVANKCGAIQKSSTVTYIFDGINLRGVPGLQEYFKDNPERLNRLKARIKECKINPPTIVEPTEEEGSEESVEETDDDTPLTLNAVTGAVESIEPDSESDSESTDDKKPRGRHKK
jgi:recombination protein RecA